jgi:hypothetical protein
MKLRLELKREPWRNVHRRALIANRAARTGDGRACAPAPESA